MKIYIAKNVYNWIHEMTSNNTHQEVGSLLVGEHFVDDLNEIHVCISNCIEAKYAIREKASLTFTHETWNYVNYELDKNFSDFKIIGWQHSHPGFGVFLSDYDLFIHKNFFDLDFQVAMVVDPVNNSEGFFYWKGNDIDKAQSFQIID